MDHTNVPQWSKATVLDPWIMLPAIAAQTRHVDLGTCVTDAIRRHPSNIALATITLDRISGGRAILGIGAGEAQNLKEFCIPFEKPVSKWEEQIQVIKKCFESSPENTVDYDGKYYKLEKACLQAKSVTKPHPPIYMAAGGKRTLSMCGKYGDGWLPIGYTPELFEDHRAIIEKSRKENNRSDSDYGFGLDIDVYFSDDAEASWAKMKEAVKVSLFKPEILRVHGLKEIEGFDFRKYFTEYSMSNQDWIVKMREAATKIPDTIARSSVAVGTPDDVIPVFERFMKAGVNHFVVSCFESSPEKTVDYDPVFGKYYKLEKACLQAKSAQVTASSDIHGSWRHAIFQCARNLGDSMASDNIRQFFTRCKSSWKVQVQRYANFQMAL